MLLIKNMETCSQSNNEGSFKWWPYLDRYLLNEVSHTRFWCIERTQESSFCNVCNGGTMIFLIHLRSKIPSYRWTFLFVLILLATIGQLVHCLHCCTCCIFGRVVGPPHLANPSIYWRNVLTRSRPYCGDSLMLQWCSMCLGNVIVKYSKCNQEDVSKCLCGQHVPSECVPYMFRGCDCTLEFLPSCSTCFATDD